MLLKSVGKIQVLLKSVGKIQVLLKSIGKIQVLLKFVGKIQVLLKSVGKIQILLKSVGKIQVLLKSDKNNRYLRECVCTFMITGLFVRIIIRIRNISDKSCTENQNTHFMVSNFFSSPKIAPFMT